MGKITRLYLSSEDGQNLNGEPLNSALMSWRVNLPEPIVNGKIYVEQCYIEVGPPAGANIFKIVLEGLGGESCYDSTNKSYSQNIFTTTFGGSSTTDPVIQSLNPRYPEAKQLTSFILPHFNLTLRFQTLRTLTNILRVFLVIAIKE